MPPIALFVHGKLVGKGNLLFLCDIYFNSVLLVGMCVLFAILHCLLNIPGIHLTGVSFIQVDIAALYECE